MQSITAQNGATKKAFTSCDIYKTHTTHAARTTAARNANRNNASEADTKAHGGWSEGGSYRACYMRELPTSTIAGLAGFDGRYPERYFVARTQVGAFTFLIHFIIIHFIITFFGGNQTDTLF